MEAAVAEATVEAATVAVAARVAEATVGQAIAALVQAMEPLASAQVEHLIARSAYALLTTRQGTPHGVAEQTTASGMSAVRTTVQTTFAKAVGPMMALVTSVRLVAPTMRPVIFAKAVVRMTVLDSNTSIP